MRAATERHRARSLVVPGSPDLLYGDVLNSRPFCDGALPGQPTQSDPSGLLYLSNKKCAHAVTHQCPYLADSNSTLCTPCAVAAASGQPCS